MPRQAWEPAPPGRGRDAATARGRARRKPAPPPPPAKDACACRPDSAGEYVIRYLMGAGSVTRLEAVMGQALEAVVSDLPPPLPGNGSEARRPKARPPTGARRAGV